MISQDIFHIVEQQKDTFDSSQLITNLITLLLGLVAAMIALYQVKSNVVSSSRINWIESLRESISSYCVEMHSSLVMLENLRDDSKGKTDEEKEVIIKKFYDDWIPVASSCEKLTAKIKLYLDNSNSNHKNLENLMDKISYDTHNLETTKLDRQQLENDIDNVIALSKIIFKEQWKKSKKIFSI